MVKILDKIQDVTDLKKLNNDELAELCDDIREFLLDNVSKTGGHLAANLGVVELTIALCLEFDPYVDRIVWDVGHQAYTYKILTGRKDKFDTLRTLDGLSGFPKASESDADAFNSGHSSTSISVATGFSAGERLKGTNAFSVAVTGDGAMTGGMAFEGMNHAGSEKLPVIVILNDNGMSISQNVGGFSRKLQKIRSTKKYLNFKSDVKSVVCRIPIIGKLIKRVLKGIKKVLRSIMLPCGLFEDLGFKYLGPIDGHNIDELREAMQSAKSLNCPAVVHIHTKKGKGYPPAEQNPDLFHGVGSFDKNTGVSEGAGTLDFSNCFGQRLCSLAEQNQRVVAVTAAMPLGTGLSKFAEKFPDRFFDVAIAEQHAVTFSAGLACSGFVPVVAIYSTFLQRAYDQIIHDVSLMNLHMVFCIDRCGPVGGDGETHQGMYDISYMTQIPNMTVLSPSCRSDLDAMLDYAINTADGPVAIRYPRGRAYETESAEREATKARLVKDGADVLIVAVGITLYDAVGAAELLEKDGISAAVADARCIKPIDKDFMKRNAFGKKLVVSIEDGTEIGGFGQQLEALLDQKVLRLAYPDEPIVQGSIEQLKTKYNLDKESIAERIKEIID